MIDEGIVDWLKLLLLQKRTPSPLLKSPAFGFGFAACILQEDAGVEEQRGSLLQ